MIENDFSYFIITLLQDSKFDLIGITDDILHDFCYSLDYL